MAVSAYRVLATNPPKHHLVPMNLQARRAARRPEELRRDAGNWRWGILYSCADDPRVIVRNRFVFGWTWNFGHPRVVPTMAFVMLLAVGPTLGAVALGAPWYAVAGAMIASTIVVLRIAHGIASGE